MHWCYTKSDCIFTYKHACDASIGIILARINRKFTANEFSCGLLKNYVINSLSNIRKCCSSLNFTCNGVVKTWKKIWPVRITAGDIHHRWRSPPVMFSKTHLIYQRYSNHSTFCLEKSDLILIILIFTNSILVTRMK